MSLYTALNTGFCPTWTGRDLLERARFLLDRVELLITMEAPSAPEAIVWCWFPICAVLKSPYAAYKAAVLLNGGFLCLGYLVSVRTQGGYFQKKRRPFFFGCLFFCSLSGAGGFQELYRAGAFIDSAGVDLPVSAALHPGKVRQGKTLGLAACMILAGFLQIAFLGVIGAVTAFWAVYVKQKRVGETSFLIFCLLC